MTKKKEVVMAHIDYENIRWRFRDYIEYITLEQVLDAFKSIGEEIGELRQVFVYGDWTRRPQDARFIEDRGYRAINVLSKRYGGDRSDPTMMFAIDDQSREKKSNTFLFGAGDADYKEVILRCRERGNKVYAACFGLSASRELFTMTEKVYPLEVHLNLTEKDTAIPTLTDIGAKASKVKYVIRRMDSLEKTLPMVVRNYLENKILLPTGKFGETSDDVDEFVSQMIEDNLLLLTEVENPKIPGRTTKCLSLNRKEPLIIETLKIDDKSEETDS
jgi:hypothetical protein